MRWLALSLVVVALAPAAAAARTKVAVMDVKNVQGVSEGTATILTDIVVSEVARFGLDVVSKSDISAIVGFEKEKTLLGCSDDSSCLAEIGGALGVDYMLTGQVGQIGSRYRISLILVDVRKSKVAGRASEFCDKDEDALANAAIARVREIIAIVQAQAAAAAQREARASAKVLPLPPPPPPAQKASGPAPLAPAPAAAPPEPEEPARPAGPGWSGKKILGVSLTGSGGLMLAGGVLFGLKARQLDSDLAASTDTLGYYYDYPAKRDEVKRTALVADVLYGVGAVAVGVGGYLWFTDRPPAVAVVPVVGQGEAGVVAMGRF